MTLMQTTRMTVNVTVDLLQFLNMFNSHVEDNMLMSLKRSDTKKNSLFLMKRTSALPSLSTISPDSCHPNFEHILYYVDSTHSSQKRKLQATVVEMSREKI